MPIRVVVTEQRNLRPAPTVETYDFRRPMTLAREHSRAIEVAGETFARQWGTQLTSRLRVVCGVGLESVQMISYDEYIATLADQTLMAVGSVENGRSTAVLQTPVELALLWIDYLLGGPGLRGVVPARELTEIETALLTDLVQAHLHDLRYAFAAVAPLDIKLGGFQYNPQFAQLVPASEPVIVLTYTIAIGDDRDTATLMVPAEHLLDALRAGEAASKSRAADAETEAARAKMHAGMREVPVDLTVQLRPLTVHPREILAMQVGDLIMLHHSASRPLDVVVDDKVLAHAVAGANGRQLACQVVDFEENER